MARFGEDRPHGLDTIESELRSDDPRFARGIETGRPSRPREYRYGPVRLLLAVAAGAFVWGIGAKQILLVAAGAVLVAAAVRLYDLQQEQVRRDSRMPERCAGGGARAAGPPRCPSAEPGRRFRARRWIPARGGPDRRQAGTRGPSGRTGS